MARKTLTNSYLSVLCLEISMLLKAGVTIPNGIMMMIEDEQDKAGKMILQRLLDTLDGAVSLSESMGKAGFFPSYMINMIAVGERSGRLAETMDALSAHYERLDRLSVTIKNAATYPAVLLGMMVVTVMILILQVLPIFDDVFGRMGAQMSPMAMRLMQFGDWFQGTSVIIAFIVCILAVIVFVIILIPRLKNGLIISFMNRWGSKGIFGRIASWKFTSSMAITLSSGLDIEESIILSAAVVSDYKIKSERCVELIRSGNPLADSLKRTGILSASNSRILSLGEQSGMIDSAMEEIARRSDRSLQDEIANLVSKIEPTLVIITSLIVGTILLSVMLPLVGIMTVIG